MRHKGARTHLILFLLGPQANRDGPRPGDGSFDLLKGPLQFGLIPDWARELARETLEVHRELSRPGVFVFHSGAIPVVSKS